MLPELVGLRCGCGPDNRARDDVLGTDRVNLRDARGVVC